eukprot:Gregarina_sp_Poly_1__5983@NODE_314_length_9596_cov_167_192570_g269_i0_p2_GENE_NODE_314_length_9596_cov_167_192570_g269_i0NODE_314_length_9596_cov_167_192570_g269_i0_p2_ORF_typecomplete_len398_score52_82_NODE_314_length_9596_cov_167_192570_g269_i069118104
MTTIPVLRFEKHELEIQCSERFEDVSVESLPTVSREVSDGGAFAVSLFRRPSRTRPINQTVLHSNGVRRLASGEPNCATPFLDSNLGDRFTPDASTSMSCVNIDGQPAGVRSSDVVVSPPAFIHPIFTPRFRGQQAVEFQSPVVAETGGDSPFDSSEAGTVHDSEQSFSEAVSQQYFPPVPLPAHAAVQISGLGELMPYTASMYRSSTLSMAQSILEITYRPTGRLAWSRLCPRLNLTKEQSERNDKDAMVALVASRLAKCGIITDSFPPEGSRRVWLVPLDHSESQGSYVVIAKSRGRKLRIAMKESFAVCLETGKRGLQHDHFLSEILARNIWWFSSKPVEVVTMPKPLYQGQYWVPDYGWSSISTLIAECNLELGTNIGLSTQAEFMEIINQKK